MRIVEIQFVLFQHYVQHLKDLEEDLEEDRDIDIPFYLLQPVPNYHNLTASQSGLAFLVI